jgi:hypothetical protein
MSGKIEKSQYADRGSQISNSKNISDNNITIKKIRTETVIISFIVGTLASILASYVYEHFMK